MTPEPQVKKTIDELTDELIIVTIDNANDWYGVEYPHDVEFYDYTVPEFKQRIKARITEAYKKGHIDGALSQLIGGKK